MQCTTQRADAQMPSLSAEKIETREELVIKTKKSFQIKLRGTERKPSSQFNFDREFCYHWFEALGSLTQTVATAGSISDTSTHCVG
jgi:hypothetical protein